MLTDTKDCLDRICEFFLKSVVAQRNQVSVVSVVIMHRAGQRRNLHSTHTPSWGEHGQLYHYYAREFQNVTFNEVVFSAKLQIRTTSMLVLLEAGN